MAMATSTWPLTLCKELNFVDDEQIMIQPISSTFKACRLCAERFEYLALYVARLSLWHITWP
jgi:hypothetical protein